MSANILKSRLTLRFHAGFTQDGKEIFKTKNFSNVNNTATDEQFGATATALASLQSHTLELVTRSNDYYIQ